ncbi:MAG TPA: alpha/beta fold hydrolase [Acidisoma sp.]|uniref:PHA/PHB synthase family protein n=1 Tax=Acidisoma sp. TaxID=1872115 RepID=UPI002CE9A98E|nr:alpha/beta fold hydrolase [Acidisoma sp.]HTI00345.1 alpha/beta fold hydrolase [Acidisoma sp.]
MQRSADRARPSPEPEVLDRLLHAWQSRFTGGAAPASLPLAWMDWAIHAANHPFRMAEQRHKAVDQWLRLGRILTGLETPVAPRPGDHRFAHPAWAATPYAQLVQAVLLGEEWWQGLIAAPGGVANHNRRLLAFELQQWLDLLSPSNFPWTNPEILAATRARHGENLLEGLANFLREQSGKQDADAQPFRLGQDLAATPGRVVFRNDLMELIQYAPTTSTVAAEPVLIVPAWIMKYYILDLSPQNSLVRWLVDQGRTVFMISWRNPDAAMRDISLDDYRTAGVMAALDVVCAICGGQKTHLAGYCLGGTLATIAAAHCAATGDGRLTSLTLFAAQTDFSEAGELQLFISEDQLDFLDDVMKTQGYLSSRQMSSAFRMLRPNDLIWSRMIRDYFLGEAPASFDLMAWNADGTRLPARMHAEYLRRLYLQNDLAAGHFTAGGQTLALDDIRLPIFVVSTETDHIAPWRSVYKLHLLNDGAITFVLTSGGHNAGIVSEPGHPHRHFRIATRAEGGHTLGPDEWQAAHAPQEGSWWPQWNAFLGTYSGPPVAPPSMGSPDLGPAPGSYVLEEG